MPEDAEKSQGDLAREDLAKMDPEKMTGLDKFGVQVALKIVDSADSALKTNRQFQDSLNRTADNLWERAIDGGQRRNEAMTAPEFTPPIAISGISGAVEKNAAAMAFLVVDGIINATGQRVVRSPRLVELIRGNRMLQRYYDKDGDTAIKRKKPKLVGTW